MPLTGLDAPRLNTNVFNVVGPFKNRIINGDMRIDQRNAGASVTPTTDGQYGGPDRWMYWLSQASKFSVQQSTTAPTGFDNSILITSLSAYSVTSSDYFGVNQKIEGFNFSDLLWGTANAKTVTLSFWVRSSLTGAFGGAFTNNAFNRSYPFSYTINAANTWEQKTITLTGDTTGTWVGSTNGTGTIVQFSLGAGTSKSGTAGTWSGSWLIQPTGSTSVVGTNGATFYITGVQLEAGSVATPFERRSYGQELALCQRYYQSINIFVSSAGYPYTFAVTKRSAPTVSSTAAGFATSGTTPTIDGTWMNQSSGSAITVAVSAEL